MGAEIAVMYNVPDPNDASKKRILRVPIEDVDQLPKTRVLFIIVSQKDPQNPRLNGNRRMAEAHGKDRYCFVFRKEWFLLYGWDDGDFKWRRHLIKPWAEASTVKPDHLPLSPASVVFEGEQLGEGDQDPLWIAAYDQFMEEMH